MTPGFPRVEGRPRAPITRLPLRLRGYSLNSLFRLIASCTSPISALGPITAVVLTNKCFPSSSRNALHSYLRPLKEKSSHQHTNLTNCTRHAVFASKRHSSRHVWCVFLAFPYPTQTLNLPSDTPIKFITSSTFLTNAAPASLKPYIAFNNL